MGTEWRASQILSARALASGECNGTSASTPHMCDRFDPSGRVGLQLGGPKLQLLTNVGRYVRVPTLGELYGISAVVRGNDALVAEQGVTGDVGVRAASGRWGAVDGVFVDTFAFMRYADDLVAWRRSSLGYVRPYNVGRARISGVEALTAAEAASFVRVEVALTLLDPRDITEGRTTVNDILPFRSRLVASPALELRTRGLASAGIQLGRFFVRYVYALQFLFYPVDNKSEAYLNSVVNWSHFPRFVPGENSFGNQYLDNHPNPGGQGCRSPIS